MVTVAVVPADLIIFNRKLSTQFLPPPPSSDLQDLLTTKARLYRENERLSGEIICIAEREREIVFDRDMNYNITNIVIVIQLNGLLL